MENNMFKHMMNSVIGAIFENSEANIVIKKAKGEKAITMNCNIETIGEFKDEILISVFSGIIKEIINTSEDKEMLTFYYMTEITDIIDAVEEEKNE